MARSVFGENVFWNESLVKIQVNLKKTIEVILEPKNIFSKIAFIHLKHFQMSPYNYNVFTIYEILGLVKSYLRSNYALIEGRMMLRVRIRH